MAASAPCYPQVLLSLLNVATRLVKVQAVRQGTTLFSALLVAALRCTSAHAPGSLAKTSGRTTVVEALWQLFVDVEVHTVCLPPSRHV